MVQIPGMASHSIHCHPTAATAVAASTPVPGSALALCSSYTAPSTCWGCILTCPVALNTGTAEPARPYQAQRGCLSPVQRDGMQPGLGRTRWLPQALQHAMVHA